MANNRNQKNRDDQTTNNQANTSQRDAHKDGSNQSDAGTRDQEHAHEDAPRPEQEGGSTR